MQNFIREELNELLKINPKLLDFVYKKSLDWFGYFESDCLKIEWINPDFLIKLGFINKEIDETSNIWETIISKKKLETLNANLLKTRIGSSFNFSINYCEESDLSKIIDINGFMIENIKGKQVVLASHIFDFNDEKQLIKNLKAKNKELKQFSYLASHDLQQPLNNIIYYLSILEENKNRLDDLEQLSITVIKKSSYKMKRYITSLLEYSIIGTKAREDKVVLNEVFSSVKEILADQIKEKNAVLDFPSNNLIMIGNQNDIHLLFLNLIENSIKFTKNEVDTKIVIDCKSENDDFLFSISDNGIGIDKIDNNKVFDIFFKINNEDNFKGIGMGLAICKKIIELYAGKIWIDSELNKGTIVYFSLPKITFC